MKLEKTAKGIWKDDTSRAIIIGVAFYFLYRSIKKKEVADDAMNGDPDNSVIRITLGLEAAFHYFFNGPFGLPDGTDKDKVKTLAYEIGTLNNLKKVQEKYQALYGKPLLPELQSEGVFDLFNQEYQRGLLSRTGSGTPTGGGNPPGDGKVYLRVGDDVFAVANYLLRSLTSPHDKKRITVAGEGFTVVKIYINKKIGQTTGTWVHVREHFSTSNIYRDEYLIFLTGLRK